ncbi:MAG: response regulator [Deltaproteobacteria bacterium]|nr:response regulator [Deltaproteobacteria bacterium]
MQSRRPGTRPAKPSKIASLYQYKSGLRQLTGRAPEHRAHQAQVINPHEHRCIKGKLDKGRIPDFAADVPSLDVPVIFVIAYGQKYTEGELQKAGGDQLIPKPVDFTALAMAIARVHLAAIRARLG